MLAREYCHSIKRKEKPVILSHHMLSGLKAGQAKMSKSDPDSAIFMEDEPEMVERKIKKAYCEPKIVLANPILDYCKSIIFPATDKMVVKCNKETEPRVYTSYEALEADFVADIIGPGDLKPAVAKAINQLL